MDSITQDLAWYCLKAQPKHEHIAAACLRQTLHVGVFCPRIRFKRATVRGAAWVTEALFPGYLFAQFDLKTMHRQVRYSQGVRDVIQFGNKYAEIEEQVIEELRLHTGSHEIVEVQQSLTTGSAVCVVAGALKGLNAVVTQVLPAKDRVKVLLDFLGRSVEAEFRRLDVLQATEHPLAS